MDQAPQATPQNSLDPVPVTERIIFDRSAKTSVVNIAPFKVAESIEEAYKNFPALFGCDEQELYKFLRSENKSPTAVDNRLRLMFWIEYDRSVAQGRKMTAGNLFAGICSADHFYGRYLQNPHKIAWLLTAPTSYLIKTEEALEFGLEQLRDILETPHVVNGKMDHKLAAIKIRTVELLYERTHGSVVQKVESKTLSISTNASPAEVKKMAAEMTVEDIERRIQAFEKNHPKVVPVLQVKNND